MLTSTTINLTEKVKANWPVLSIIASEVKQAKEAEKDNKKRR